MDKEKTKSFNWMRKNKEFLNNLHTMGDFVFFNDIYSLATGKDWLSGSKKNKLESAAWLALAALPVSKLSKIAKELKAGNKLLKGVDLTAKDLKILQGAGYFGEAATKGL